MVRILILQAPWGFRCTCQFGSSAHGTNSDRTGPSVTRSWVSRRPVAVWAIGGSTGYGMNVKWNHYYHRLGLIYDALRNCKAKVSVFADWVHTDDTVTVNCSRLQ